VKKEILPENNYLGLIFQKIERKHLKEWFEYLIIPEFARHTSWDVKNIGDIERLEYWYNSFEPDSPIRFAIVDELTNALVGTIGFNSISPLNKSGEVSYDIAPPYWTKGIGTNVCKSMIKWGFFELDFVRIQATVLDTNSASEKVLLNCGFCYEGLLRSYRLVRGQPRDYKMYSILRSDVKSIFI